jgi:hypothetical protein
MKEIPLPKATKNKEIEKKIKIHTKDAFILLYASMFYTILYYNVVEYTRLGCLTRMSSEYTDLQHFNMTMEHNIVQCILNKMILKLPKEDGYLVQCYEIAKYEYGSKKQNH